MSQLEKIKSFDEALEREGSLLKDKLKRYKSIIINEHDQYIDINLYDQLKTIYEQMVHSAKMGNFFSCNKYINRCIMMIDTSNGNIIKKINVPNQLTYLVNGVKNGESYYATCEVFEDNELNSVLDSVENVFTDLFENTSEAINVEGKKHDIERHLQSMNFILNKYFRKDNELSDVSGDTIKNIMTSILMQTIRKTYLSDLVSDWITTKEASIISGLTPRQIRSIFIEDDLVLAKKEHNTWYIQLESFIYQYMVWCKGEIDD